MQYLTRAILSSFLPRSLAESRGAKIVLAVVGTAVAVLVVLVFFRFLHSPEPSVPNELGLQSLVATDKNGAKWVIEPAAAQPFARLRESGVEPGLPLAIRTDMRRDGSDRVSVGLTLEGRAGERYSPQVSKDGERLAAPEFTVVDEAGQTAFKGRFEYG